MSQAAPGKIDSREVQISVGQPSLSGELNISENAVYVVPFAHDFGSSGHSTRNECVARTSRREDSVNSASIYSRGMRK